MSRVDLLLKEANVMAHQYGFFLRLTYQTLLHYSITKSNNHNHKKIKYMIFKQNCTDCLHLKNPILSFRLGRQRGRETKMTIPTVNPPSPPPRVFNV